MTKHKPEHWRQRAEEMRRAADERRDDPETRIAMLRLATGYERLAAKAQERTKKRTAPES